MDSLMVCALCRELDESLAGGRIDKIHQPSGREIVLTIRSRSGTVRLLLSAHRASPRAHILYHARPANPEEPPMFCMLLRRRLEGGRITAVRQLDDDRILALHVESINDLGDMASFVLVLELMGKHSNLMVCETSANGRPGKILDSIAHISPDQSRVRPVLPGFHYTPVPTQAKLPLATLTAYALRDVDWDHLAADARAKQLIQRVAGIGPLTAREAVFRAATAATVPGAVPTAGPTEHADTDTATHLAAALSALLAAVHTGSETPCLQLDHLGRPVAAAPFTISHANSTVAAESANAALDTLYQASLEIHQTSRLAHQLSKAVTDTLDKLRGKLTKLTRQLEESVTHEALRVQGELLTTYASEVKKGASEVILPNYYDDERPLTIALNPAQSAIENAQRYFKQASKRKRAIPILTREREETLADMAYLEAVAVHLQDATTQHLQAIREEIVRQGFLRTQNQATAKQANSKTGKQHPRARGRQGDAPLPPETYLSSDGFVLRVGRNNVQNDRLTLKSSQPHDVWLHVKDQPGSHVVVQTDKRNLPESTLHEAALLAAYFSKGRDSANVAVDYTLARHVWKPNGARPGHVLYDNQKTLYVTPERSLIQAVLARVQ